MTVKFSDFVIGSTPRTTDIVVGLRGNVNEQFNYNGVADSLGNLIISYSVPIGPGSAVNHINISSAFSGNGAVLGTAGNDMNVDLSIAPQGLGNVHIMGTGALYLPAGTTGEEPTPSIGGLRYNTTIGFLEYSNGTLWSALAAGAGFVGTPPIMITGSTISLQTPLEVQYGGTGNAAITAFAPLVGGTSTTNPLQSVSAIGAIAGYVLTFNSVGSLPSWQVAAGTGTVSPGLVNELAYYQATGNTVVGLLSANNGALITSNTGVPSISSTLPNAVQLNITQLGTITVGVWNGTAIDAIHGGTGQITYALGDTLYASATNTLSKLSGNITTAKQYLSQTGTGAVSAAPIWSTISGGDITGAALTEVNDTNVTLTLGGSPATALLNATSLTLGWTGTLSATRGGLGLSNPTAHGILIGEGASAVTSMVLASGQVLIGSTGVDPVAAFLTAGTAIQITNSAGSISIANTGVTSNLATANQTTVSSATGAVTIGLASNAILPGTGGVTLPSGNTAARAGGAGTIRFNSQTGVVELTVDGSTWTTVETSATGVLSVTGTANRITSTGGTTPVIDISAAYVGQTSITTLGTITTGTWNAAIISPTFGGMGVNNGTSTITLGGNLALSGAFATTLNITGATNITLPTSGTLLSTATTITVAQGGTGNTAFTAYAPIVGGTTTTNPLQSVIATGALSGYVLTFTGAASLPTWQLSAGSGTVSSGTINQLAYYAATGSTVSGLATSASGVLVTSAGSVPSISSTLPPAVQTNITSTGALAAGSLATGFTLVPLSIGGTNANLTANNGGIFYSTATSGAILSAAANANQILMAGGPATPPTWSTAIYPATVVQNGILYGASINNVSQLGTGNNRVMVTGGTGAPLFSTSLPVAVMLSINELSTVTTGTWQADIIQPTWGGTGVNNGASTITLGGSLIHSGAFSTTIAVTATTSVTLPTSGTLLSTATPVTLAQGGTSANLTANNGGIFYSTASAGAILAGTATANQILMSGSNSAPSWSLATYPAGIVAQSLLYASSANSISGFSLLASSILGTDASSNLIQIGALTNGQLVIGNTGGSPTRATLTAGTGITITNGAGSITVASNGSPTPIVNQTTASVTMSANTVYMSSAGASLITYTLPATANIGDMFEINGSSTGGWTIAQNAGQTIHENSVSSTTGVTGTANSTQRYNCIKLRCSVTNTDFVASYTSGNINYL